MIIFFAPGGRLGNLLFQIALIETIRKPHERIFATHLRNSKQVLPGLRRYLTTNSWFWLNVIDHLLKPILFHLFVKTRVFKSLKECDGQLVYTQGLFPVTYLEGYFQSEQFLSQKAVSKIQLAKEYLPQAELVLQQAQNRRPVFVHVRRGDYLWADHLDYLLPLEYYQQAIENLQKRFHDLHFFLVSDDPDWCKQNFCLEFMTISRLPPAQDLALMSLCEGGVISNSTFAWWGARLCRQSIPVIGPQYWLGWKKKTWHPQGIQSLFIEWVEVPPMRKA